MDLFFFGDGGRGSGKGPGQGHGRRHRRRHGQPSELTLADIGNGKAFRILQNMATGEIRQRLLDMGFIRGAVGRMLREALLKDPLELQLLDYKVSLRRAEARTIIVEEIE